jgi:hypothetical protein
VSFFIAEKSEVKSVALICGSATDVLAAAELVVGDEDVVDELHPETATTSPTESSAPVSATDLRAVSIVFPFVVNSPKGPASYRYTVAFIRNRTGVSLSNCDEQERRFTNVTTHLQVRGNTQTYHQNCWDRTLPFPRRGVNVLRG